MRFSRHAKNKARSIGVSVADVERLMADAAHQDFDSQGRPRFTGYVRGMRVRMVVALDDPGLIVTIHERRS